MEGVTRTILESPRTKIKLVPLSRKLFGTYIDVGTRAYNQHYLHLWKNQDPTPYLQCSFTLKVLEKEERDRNTELYLVYRHTEPVGIVKVTKDRALGPYPARDALLVDKIYLLNAYSGMGIGRAVLDLTISRAQELEKKVLWLDTMQNGPALRFYLKNGFEIHGEAQLEFPTSLEKERPMYILVKTIAG